jgi:preprotein translocase subunit SecE
MSAQRRTVERGQGVAVPGEVAAAKPVPAGPSRPPKPVAPTAPEAQGRFGGRFDDLKKSYQDTVAELKKVNWPDRETTKNLTLVVIAVSIVLGLLLGGVDYVLQSLFAALP